MAAATVIRWRQGTRAAFGPAHRAPIWPEARRQLADADDRRRLLCHGRARGALDDERRPTRCPTIPMSPGRSRWHCSARGRTASHNDPLYAAEPAAAQWHLADLHRIATGRGVKVAVIDSGIEVRHPDLAGQILMSRNFVAGRSAAAEQHGTGVAGIIAAKADNGIGIAGVAPGARLLGLRACWQTPGATVCDTLESRQSHLLCRRSARGHHQSQPQRPRGPAARRAAEDGPEAWQRHSHGLRPEACRRRIPRVHARRDRSLRHVIGTVARRRLHCAGTGRAHDSARRTMVSRQWQLFCRSACQRADRFDAGAAAFRVTRPGLRAARRRSDRCLCHIGEGSGRL